MLKDLIAASIWLNNLKDTDTVAIVQTPQQWYDEEMSFLTQEQLNKRGI